MKNLLLIAIVFIVFLGCKKDAPVAPVVPNIVGLTYFGFYFFSDVTHSSIYAGYKFVSETRALELLFDADKVYSSVEVGYSYSYPNLKIDQSDPQTGKWSGVLSSDGVLTIRSIQMKKL